MLSGVADDAKRGKQPMKKTSALISCALFALAIVVHANPVPRIIFDTEILRGLSPEILKEIAFSLAPEARIWHNSCAESFSRADVVLRDPSGRAAWLADGAEEGFCNYLMFKGRE
jgi:hypothetical protein